MRLVALAGLPLALVAACGSGSTGSSASTPVLPPVPGATAVSPPAGSPTPAATSPATSPTASPAATPSDTPPPASASASASADEVSPCRDGQVTVAGEQGRATGGTLLGGARFALIGTTPCSLYGYAGLDVVTSKGTLHAQRGTLPTSALTGPETAVTLRPDTTASVGFQWSESPSSGEKHCPKARQLVLTPPGLRTSMTVKLTGNGPVCSTPQVGHVVPTP